MNAVTYLRSTATNDDAIVRQRQTCQELAQKLGAFIDTEFIDTSKSDDIISRPGLAAMLHYLQHKPVDLVVMDRGNCLASKRELYNRLIVQIGKLGTTVIARDRHIYLFDKRES